RRLGTIFFFQAEDGIRDPLVTGVQTCALPIYRLSPTSVYRRFRSPVPAPRAYCLARLLDLDHHDREALAAVVGDEVVAVARYARSEERRVGKGSGSRRPHSGRKKRTGDMWQAE